MGLFKASVQVRNQRLNETTTAKLHPILIFNEVWFELLYFSSKTEVGEILLYRGTRLKKVEQMPQICVALRFLGIRKNGNATI